MKKQIVYIFTILAFLFLTAQTCTITSTGLAGECVGENDIVCDDDDAYQCQLASYGVGFYVTRASGYDSECGYVEEIVEVDSDGDTVPDSSDRCEGYNDNNDQDSDNIPDGCDDSDNDSISDYDEIMGNTEFGYTSDPNDDDSDDDGLTDGEEADLETDPNDPDTDDDVYLDGAEVDAGTDPLEASSSPEEVTGVDLEIIDLVLKEVDGLYATFTISFKNSGDDDITLDQTFKIELTSYDLGNEVNDDIRATITDGLNANEDGEVELSVEIVDLADYFADNPSATSLTLPFFVEIDIDGTITETDETNNDKTVSITFDEDVSFCIDSDDGLDYTEQGTTTGTFSTEEEVVVWIDNCQGNGNLGEFYCKSYDAVYVSYVDCETAVGTDYVCLDGECVILDTDGDGYSDGEEVDAGTDPLAPSDYPEETYISSSILDDIELETYYSEHELLMLDIDDFEETTTDSGYAVITDGTITGYTVGGIDIKTDTKSSVYKYLYVRDTTTEDYVYFPYGNVDSKYNINAWVLIKVKVRPTEESVMRPIVIHPSSTCSNPQYSLIIEEGEYQFSVNLDGTDYPVKGGAVTLDAWQEVIGIYNGETLYLYVDGEKVATESASGLLTASTTKNLFIGFSDTSCSETYDFEGDIDYAYVWGE